MSSLVKLVDDLNNNLGRLGKFYDDVVSHIQSLSSLGITIKNYGSLKSTLILGKLLQKQINY